MPINPNLNQRTRHALYMLKRQYGDGPVSFYKSSGSQVDLKTGVKSQSKEVTVVRRVIILPATTLREAVRSISLISADKSFVAGGFFDAATRMFILDRRDTPELTLKEDDWLVYRNQRYEFKSIQHFEIDAGYVIMARHLVGEIPEQVFPQSLDHLLDLSVSASVSK